MILIPDILERDTKDRLRNAALASAAFIRQQVGAYPTFQCIDELWARQLLGLELILQGGSSFINSPVID